MGMERQFGGMRVKKKVVIGALIAFALVVALGAAVQLWWHASAYKADAEARSAVADEDGAEDGVTVRRLDAGNIAFIADDPIAGLVFYPGANVEAEAYAVLLTQCARAGVTCVIVNEPHRFALLAINEAADIIETFPEIDEWLVAGHSLGGVAACEFASGHLGEIEGIVLLAAYSTVDLSAFGGDAASIVGSEDQVLNWDAYEEARDDLPEGSREILLDGGNHAQFGNYGEQRGDGVAAITRDEQQSLTVDAIAGLAEAL